MKPDEPMSTSIENAEEHSRDKLGSISSESEPSDKKFLNKSPTILLFNKLKCFFLLLKRSI